ncbi:hypothetical protein DRN69_06710, partial [Candidatus Pacearchaeota archaeon]
KSFEEEGFKIALIEVDSSHRRKGIARLLIEKLTNKIEEIPLWTQVVRQREEFFEEIGFQQITENWWRKEKKCASALKLEKLPLCERIRKAIVSSSSSLIGEREEKRLSRDFESEYLLRKFASSPILPIQPIYSIFKLWFKKSGQQVPEKKKKKEKEKRKGDYPVEDKVTISEEARMLAEAEDKGPKTSSSLFDLPLRKEINHTSSSLGKKLEENLIIAQKEIATFGEIEESKIEIGIANDFCGKRKRCIDGFCCFLPGGERLLPSALRIELERNYKQ